jgi:hypothetical protein
MRVYNFEDKVNQFIIHDDEGNEFLQSYDSIIVKIDNQGNISLGNNWDYSKTTGKYRNLYLGETKKETQEKLDSGEYTLDLTL